MSGEGEKPSEAPIEGQRFWRLTCVRVNLGQRGAHSRVGKRTNLGLSSGRADGLVQPEEVDASTLDRGELARRWRPLLRVEILEAREEGLLATVGRLDAELLLLLLLLLALLLLLLISERPVEIHDERSTVAKVADPTRLTVRARAEVQRRRAQARSTSERKGHRRLRPLLLRTLRS